MTEDVATVSVDTEEKKTRKGRKARPKHPAAQGNGSLTGTPGDFNFEMQGRLVFKDFKEEYQFLYYRAEDAKFRADSFQTQATESKALGNTADRKKAKKLVGMRDKMQELMDSLRDQGIDVDKLLKKS